MEVTSAEDFEACDYHILGCILASVDYGGQVFYCFVEVVDLDHWVFLSRYWFSVGINRWGNYTCEWLLLQVIAIRNS